MSLRTFVIGGVSALGGLCLALVIVGSSAAHTPPDNVAPMVGRYQLAIAGQTAGNYMTDTVTGDCWNQINNGEWISVGNPRTKPDESK